jgi:processive 1,2-diacylglycerol beta-glucosyltransferase
VFGPHPHRATDADPAILGTPWLVPGDPLCVARPGGPERASLYPVRGPGTAGRVVLVSASIGAGHDRIAAELARRLRARGFDTECHDFLATMPLRTGSFIRGAFRVILRRVPWGYGLVFAAGGRFRSVAALSRLVLRPTHYRLRRLIPPDTVAVVSTFPLSSQALGSMRRRGLFTAPLITVLTDFAVHTLWVAPGVEVHIALHEASAEQARKLRANGVVVSGPAVAPAFKRGSSRTRAEARQRFGLPVSGRLALLVTGSWGVGEVRAAAAEIERTGTAAVVACGRNRALSRRLQRAGVGHVLHWVDDMPALMGCVDVLVENAGGLSSLQAMASGLPLVSYRPIPGHGRANIATMAAAGVTRWVRRPEELRPTMVELTDGLGGQRERQAVRALFRSDPADVVADVADGAIRAEPPAGRTSASRKWVRERRRGPVPVRIAR